MTPPDLDARVAAKIARLQRHREWQELSHYDTSDTDSDIALIRDLHAALKAARGGEFEAWAVYYDEEPMLGGSLGELQIHAKQHDAERLCGAIRRAERDLGYTVRRVLCRLAPDDGGEG